MIISVTSACVSITSIRQPQGGVTIGGLTLPRSVSGGCCQRRPTPPPPVELKELQAISRGRCLCDLPDGENDICYRSEFTGDDEREIQFRNSGSNGSSRILEHNKYICPLFECKASDRKTGGRNGRTLGGRTAGDWGIIPSLGKIDFSVEEKKEAASGDEKDSSCRTSSTLERNLDMALFIVVVMLLISYIIIIIIVSF